MMKPLRVLSFLGTVFIALNGHHFAHGQAGQDTSRASLPGFSARAQKAIRAISARSVRKYEEEAVAIGQQKTLENIEKEIRVARLFIKNELDTAMISAELTHAKASFAIVKRGLIVEKGGVQAHRNLSVSGAVLTQLLQDISLRKVQVDKMAETVVRHRFTLDSLSTDSLLYTLSSDSAKIISYLKKLQISNLSIGPADSLIDRTIYNLQNMQARIDPLVFELNFASESVEAEKESLSRLLFKRELNGFWHPLSTTRPFGEILLTSLSKERMAFEFYLRNNVTGFLFLAFSLLVSVIFLRSLRNRYTERPLSGGAPKEDILVLNNPFVSSVLITFSLFQFIFVDPPFVISVGFWFISICCLTWIFYGFISNYWRFFWITMSLLFCMACLTNLLLQVSLTERLMMVFLTLAGPCLGIHALTGNRRQPLKEQYILLAIRFFVIVEALALIFNLFGRYNLSKTLMMCGYVGLIIAILFLWTVRLIDDTLRLSNMLYKNPDRKLFYVNFDKLGNRAPTLLYVLLCLGWIILVGRNYYEFKQLLHPFNQYVTEIRSIGDYQFTIRDLMLFIGITGSSVMISRIVSFFATEPGIQPHDAQNSGSTIAANWLLLIRIVVVTSGILLAFAASGIALDRLTIVLGALGVGIGLGLQNLVTNLASGLIIAFERPVSVGDQVEVNGKLGTMKSVGFRSSIISLVDGACMIVPNGDLLSQHLINWTMGKERRMLIITVGVAYGTDLALVKKILMQLLVDNERIVSRPAPVVVAKEFGESAIEFQLIFWVRSMDQVLSVRSEVIEGIDILFRQNGIAMPFPQQDIYLKNFDGVPENKKPALD
jgi:potassium efflux system protein